MGIQRISMGLCSLPVIGLSKVPGLFPEIGFTAIFSSFMVLSMLIMIYPIHGIWLAFNERKIQKQEIEMKAEKK